MKRRRLAYCGFYTFAQPNFFILDPELSKRILSKDFQHFTDRCFFVNEEIDPFSAHLLSLKGSQWKLRRNKISPTFTSGKMKMMFETLLNCTKDLRVLMEDFAENYQIFNANEIFERFTIDIIGSCGFGIECNSLRDPNSEFTKYGKKALKEGAWHQFKMNVSIFAPNLFDSFRIPLNSPDVTRFFMNTVKETLRYREENNVVRKDFMHLMIQLKNNVKIENDDNIGELKSKDSGTAVSLTDQQIAAEAFLFFFAGFETSARTLTFCFYELASNMEIQEKLRTEIQNVLAKYGGRVTYDAVMEMTYMQKCISETLRKYPPIPGITRKCTERYKLPDTNVIIEKDVLIFVPISAFHHDPEYYPNPEKFDPERFSSENQFGRHQYAWLPFGEGPRACIGMRFAIMQVKVGLAALLQKYKFSVNSKTQIPFVFDPMHVFLTPKHGIWLNVEKIK
ncbi:hypothetical protein ILUMI_09728 [Ignelater luminosus]|uniref:Cytochrome P450 n=1 Tax=Ignelater luminosus TaxID=2038154 RepID=A0A8K0D4J0_IGNLU|nr:hypothetical protein ILUMI_09728 [Ignelater luminosus]